MANSERCAVCLEFHATILLYISSTFPAEMLGYFSCLINSGRFLAVLLIPKRPLNPRKARFKLFLKNIPDISFVWSTPVHFWQFYKFRKDRWSLAECVSHFSGWDSWILQLIDKHRSNFGSLPCSVTIVEPSGNASRTFPATVSWIFQLFDLRSRSIFSSFTNCKTIVEPSENAFHTFPAALSWGFLLFDRYRSSFGSLNNSVTISKQSGNVFHTFPATILRIFRYTILTFFLKDRWNSVYATHLIEITIEIAQTV